jgi:hypothetical protein
MRAALDLMAAAASAVGLGGLRPAAVVGAVVALYGAVGAAGGLWAWWVAGRVARRLGARS